MAACDNLDVLCSFRQCYCCYLAGRMGCDQEQYADELREIEALHPGVDLFVLCDPDELWGRVGDSEFLIESK